MRHYNGQAAAERRNVDTPEEITFAERFPIPLEENKDQSRKASAKEVPHPRAADAQDRGQPETEGIGEQEENISEGTIDTGVCSPPTSGERVDTASDDREVEGFHDGMEDHEDDIEKTTFNMDQSIPSLESTFDSDETLAEDLEDDLKDLDDRDDLDDLTARLVNEKKRALEDIARSQELEPQPKEGGKWVPLEERDGFNKQPQRVAALGEHADLELETGLQSREIHILGTGSVGKYIASALAGLSDAPTITLLMHRPLLMQKWHEQGARIQLLRNGKIITTPNVNIESSADFHRESPTQRFPGFGENLQDTAEPPDTVIENLIVTTAGFKTVTALSAIKSRLRHWSTICFIQDGLGVTDLVNSEVFPDPALRPSYLLGNMSHAFQSTERKFTFVETRPGTINLTMSAHEAKRGFQKDELLIERSNHQWTSASTFLMRTLSRAPELGVRGLPESEFYKNHVLKLAVNSVIGPLSVMYDCYNDELLCNYQVTRSMKFLLKEISTVLHSLPELPRHVGREKLFNEDKLEAVIVGVLTKTGKNRTPMLQAVRKGKRTDIDFYNGYLVNRAKDLGIDCPNLELMIAMVKGKQAMKSRERNSFIAFKV